MPLNLDLLGARALADALRNPAISSRVTLEARNAGSIVWAGTVAQVSQTGNTLRVRGYSETIADPVTVDAVTIEYGKDSVRGGIASGDFSLVSASPLPGYYLEFIFLVAATATPPSLTDPEYVKRAKTSAEEAAESAAAALASKQNAAEAEAIATAKAASATTSANTAEAKKNQAVADAETVAAKKTQATDDADAAEAAKSRAESAATNAEAALAGMVVAAPMSIAGDNQVVRGDDLRLGQPGGVELQPGATLDASSLVLKGDFTFVLECRFPTGGIGYILRSGNTPAYIHLADDGTGLQYTSGPPPVGVVTIPRGRMISLAFVRQGTVINVYVDGTYAGQFSGVSTGDWFGFGATIGHSSSAQTWRLRAFRAFNRILTPAELKLVAKGETPAALAALGLSAPPSTPFNGRLGFAAWSSFAASPNQAVVASDATVYQCACSFPLPSGTRILPGQRARIRYQVTSYTGTAAPIETGLIDNASGAQMAAPNNGSWSLSGNGVGDFELTNTTGQTITNGVVFFYGGPAPVVRGFTYTLLDVQVIGTVEAFEPWNLTTKARWIGTFGASLLASPGVTALNPRPLQDYVYSLTYNLNTQQVVAGRLPPGYSGPNRIYAGGVWFGAPTASNKTERITATAGVYGVTDVPYFTSIRKGTESMDSGRIVCVWSGAGVKADVDIVDIHIAVTE